MMLLRYINRLPNSWCILIISILLSSCKKEKDFSFPTIVFLEPAASDIFQFNQNIPIRAHITDDRTIQLVRINITDQNGTVYMNTISFQPVGQSHFEVNQSILFDDLQLVSGNYYVTISASDGENVQTAFRLITLVEAPRILKKVMVLTQTDDGLLIDTIASNQSMPWTALPIQYRFGNLNSKFQLFTAAHSGGQISNYTPSDMAMVSTASIPNSFGTAYFRCVSADATIGDTYVGCADGSIKKMNRFGQVGQWFSIPNGLIPNKLAVTNNFVVAQCQNILNTAHSLVAIHKSSGVLFNSATLDFEPRNVLSTGQNTLLVAGNSGGNAVFKKYQIYPNQLSSFFTPYNTTTVLGCWSGINGNIAVSHLAGLVLYNANLLPISAPFNLQPNEVRTNQVNGQHYVVTSSGVHIVNPQLDQEIAYMSKSGVIDLILHYNK